MAHKTEEVYLRRIQDVRDSYAAISDLKKKINEECAEAVAAIREKYADELKQLEDSHEMFVMLTSD